MDVLEAFERDFLFNARVLHGEAVVTALEVLVAQNRAAHDGQVRVGANEIMGEGLYKVQQLFKGAAVDLHGHMLGVEYNAVLIVVDVGGILQAPGFAADLNGNDPVVGPGGMVHPARVALVLPAQLAFGIGSLGGIFGSGDGFGVLFGLGQVDGDVHFAILAGVFPAHVLLDPVAADVVCIATEAVIPVRGLHRGSCILFPEGTDDLPGHGGHSAHDPGVENIPGGDVVLAQALGHGIVQDARQNFLQILRLRLVGGRIVVLAQNVQQPVGQHLVIRRLRQPPIHGIGHQGIDVGFDFHSSFTPQF